MKRIEHFMLHNDLGEKIFAKDLIAWSLKQKPFRTFNSIGYSWEVEGEKFYVDRRAYWSELPDASGFICFEDGFYPDNCYVLDVYGRLRYQLTVPWDLTNYDVPCGAKMWFRNVGTHSDGEFGVTAWIEYAGDFYFELDYHKGKFLWGKEIRF